MPIISQDSYPAWSALTITLASLPTSSTLLVGRASTAVSNTTDKFLDVSVAGKIMAGASPTGGVIEVWAYASFDGTSTYPDSITGTDADKTMTSANVKSSALKFLWATSVDAVSDRPYFMPPTSIAQVFGQVPSNWGLFVTHSTAVPLNGTGGNHVLSYRGTKYASA